MASPTVSAASLTPKERGELTRQFVTKWGMYVQRVYNVPVDVWAKRMVPNFVAADAANFRNALKRDTLEGALAQLNGSGHRLSDNQVIDRMAKLPAAGRIGTTGGIAPKFGDLNRDLVYTPVPPCRIIDTRNMAAGAIPADSTYDFYAITNANFANQGGSATNCGVGTTGITAVAINLTAVTPSVAGYATAYPFGTTRPLASSLNYAAGAIVNNALIVQVPNPLSTFDFTIYTFAQSHYVADIVGYFAVPQATELECVSATTTTSTIAANASTFFVNAACPTGYKATTPYCFTTATGVYNQGSGFDSNNPTLQTFCAWQNTNATSKQVFGATTCCRVPGR